MINKRKIDIKNLKIHPLLEQLRDNPIAGNGENNYMKSFDGANIFYRTWNPQHEVEKIVVVSHGMAGHGEFFVLLADKLINQGIKIIAPDYRNHGLSEGKKGDIRSFKTLIKDLHFFLHFIKKKNPNVPIFIFGESMGGVVNINYSKVYHDDFLNLSGLILFSPAVKPNIPKKTWFGIALASLPLLILRALFPSKKIYSTESDKDEGIANPIHQRYDQEEPLHIKKVSIRYILQMFKYMRKTAKIAHLISIPTIIFQGRKDRGISAEAVENFYERLGSKDKEVHLIEEGYHELITDPSFQDKWDVLYRWLRDH